MVDEAMAWMAWMGRKKYSLEAVCSKRLLLLDGSVVAARFQGGGGLLAGTAAVT
jgi:hypothetical protein